MNRSAAIVGSAIIFALAVMIASLFVTGILPPSSSASSTESSAASESTSGEPSTSNEQSEPASAPLSRVLLSIAQDGTALLARTGSCLDGHPSTVQVISPGQPPMTMPHPPAEVVRVHAWHGSFMVAGADSDCEIDTYTSEDGSTWTTKDHPPANWWTFMPGGLSSTLQSGAGIVDLGCPVIAMTAVQVSKVFAGCADGTFLATTNRGISWGTSGAVAGLVDLAFIDEAHGYALASAVDCASSVLETVDAGTTWTQVACLESSQPAAIAAIDSLIAVAAGESLWLSTDSGHTWSTWDVEPWR